jgi:hypothetical protein
MGFKSLKEVFVPQIRGYTKTLLFSDYSTIFYNLRLPAGEALPSGRTPNLWSGGFTCPLLVRDYVQLSFWKTFGNGRRTL